MWLRVTGLDAAVRPMSGKALPFRQAEKDLEALPRFGEEEPLVIWWTQR